MSCKLQTVCQVCLGLCSFGLHAKHRRHMLTAAESYRMLYAQPAQPSSAHHRILVPAEAHGVPSRPGKGGAQGQKEEGHEHRGAAHHQKSDAQEGAVPPQGACRAEDHPLLTPIAVAVVPAPGCQCGACCRSAGAVLCLSGAAGMLARLCTVMVQKQGARWAGAGTALHFGRSNAC